MLGGFFGLATNGWLEVRGDHQLQLHGEFLPLGFLALEDETPEEPAPAEDMSSMEAVACISINYHIVGSSLC